MAEVQRLEIPQFRVTINLGQVDGERVTRRIGVTIRGDGLAIPKFVDIAFSDKIHEFHPLGTVQDGASSWKLELRGKTEEFADVYRILCTEKDVEVHWLADDSNVITYWAIGTYIDRPVGPT